jgi:copper transport protein
VHVTDVICSIRTGDNPVGQTHRRTKETSTVARSSVVARVVGALLLVVGVLMVGAMPALAHAELVTSTPAEGSTVVGTPEAIVLEFSAPTEPAGDPIKLVDEAGQELQATVVQVSETVIEIRPDQELAAGSHGVVWSVKAGDQHPRTGVVTFGVVQQPASAVPDAADDPSAPIDQTSDDPSASEPTVAPIEVESARSVVGVLLGPIGRWIALLGTLIGIGSLAFAATALTGSRREVHNAAFWVRRSGIAVVLGTVIEVVAAVMVINGSAFAALWPPNALEIVWSTFGIAVLLRLVGGIAMTTGMGLIHFADPDTSTHPGGQIYRPSSSVQTLEVPAVSATHRLDLSHSVIAVLGTAAVTMSYLFDGHTVTASPGFIVKLSDLVHVAGAGVWLGGVLMLSWVLTGRHRKGTPLRAGELAVRFSRVAGAALGAVGVAGLILTWAILDTPSELVSTPWGRLLILKVAAVAVAASIGAYNHRYVVPRLELDTGDATAGDELRRTVRIEGILLISVVVVTAILVGLSS